MVIGPAGQLAELLLLICTCVIISDGAVYDADRMSSHAMDFGVCANPSSFSWV